MKVYGFVCSKVDIKTYEFEKADVPKFIATYGKDGDLNLYTTDDDAFLLSTFGIFLNKIDFNYRQEIIEELMQYQMGDKEVPEFECKKVNEVDFMEEYQFADCTEEVF